MSAFCYPSVRPGGCSTQSCRKRHDITLCSCGIVTARDEVQAHLAGVPHQQALAALQRGRNQPPQSQRPQSAAIPDKAVFFCDLCQWEMPASKSGSHARFSVRHLRLQAQVAVQTELGQIQRNQKAIIISGDEDGVDFGVTEVQDGAAKPSMALTVNNTSPRKAYELRRCQMASSFRQGQRPSFSIDIVGEHTVHPGQQRSLQLALNSTYPGRYEDRFELVIYDVARKKQFVIGRKVTAVVGSREEHEILRPKAPYVRRIPRPLQKEAKVIPTMRPETWSSTQFVKRLLQYEVPQSVADLAGRGDARQLFAKSYMPPTFDSTTYGRYFKVLLQLEEVQMALDLQMYSIDDGKLKAKLPYYMLAVPGLEEGRPTVLVGDFVRVKLAGSSTDVWWEGRVQEVQATMIKIRFSSDFSIYRGNEVQVRFVLNRLPLRRMHAAVSNTFNPPRLLFPAPEHIIGSPFNEEDIQKIVPVNRNVGGDREQLEAIAAILKQPPGSIPFVLFGPPGTGKTVVAIEAVKQILIRDPEARILCCAPSNSAADLLGMRLLDLGPSQVFRLNAASRKYPELPGPLRVFSLSNDHEVFAIPSLDKMKGYRVIIATCISGGIPEGIGMPRGWFKYIFVDEAGQATESEVMVPIKSMSGPRTNVVLFGDNQQLGPICASKTAESLGLKTSFLARIMDLNTYHLTTMKNFTVVKLVKNWRNHAAILEFPNAQFYNGELQAAGDHVMTHSLIRSEQLVKSGFPIVFHGIVGKDERESSNPSFFNRDEAVLVKKYCMNLVSDRKFRLRPEHIGIIAPYHSQVVKIRELCRREPKLEGIKIGSVEEFQGQERRVIILSTVRSTTDYVNADLRRNLGFVANPRRFNVAVTRAQALLIVVGNPRILSLDSLWRTFLNFIHRKGGWRGEPIAWDPVEPILASAEYDRDLRERAETEIQDDLTRLRALIFEHSEDLSVPNVLQESEDEEEDAHVRGMERPMNGGS